MMTRSSSSSILVVVQTFFCWLILLSGNVQQSAVLAQICNPLQADPDPDLACQVAVTIYGTDYQCLPDDTGDATSGLCRCPDIDACCLDDSCVEGFVCRCSRDCPGDQICRDFDGQSDNCGTCCLESEVGCTGDFAARCNPGSCNRRDNIDDCTECERTVVDIDGDNQFACFQCDCDECATDGDCVLAATGDTCVIVENQLCGTCGCSECSTDGDCALNINGDTCVIVNAESCGTCQPSSGGKGGKGGMPSMKSTKAPSVKSTKAPSLKSTMYLDRRHLKSRNRSE